MPCCTAVSQAPDRPALSSLALPRSRPVGYLCRVLQVLGQHRQQRQAAGQRRGRLQVPAGARQGRGALLEPRPQQADLHPQQRPQRLPPERRLHQPGGSSRGQPGAARARARSPAPGPAAQPSGCTSPGAAWLAARLQPTPTPCQTACLCCRRTAAPSLTAPRAAPRCPPPRTPPSLAASLSPTPPPRRTHPAALPPGATRPATRLPRRRRRRTSRVTALHLRRRRARCPAIPRLPHPLPQ
jgi:hypothetical protein